MRIRTIAALTTALCATCAPLSAQSGTTRTGTRKTGTGTGTAPTTGTAGTGSTGTGTSGTSTTTGTGKAGVSPATPAASTGKTAATPTAMGASTARVAASPAAPAQSSGSSTSIGLRVGTLGLGLEISHLLSDHIGLRVGGNYLSLNQKRTEESITYDATAKLQSFSGLLDWYPGRRGAFHISAGAVTNPLTVDGVGVPEGGSSYTINGRDYTASQVGTFTSTAKFGSVLPYVGIGFGTPASKSHGIGVLFDVGAAIGKPTVVLNSSNAANVPGLAADIRAETVKVQDSANALVVWPVVSLGLTYRF